MVRVLVQIFFGVLHTEFIDSEEPHKEFYIVKRLEFPNPSQVHKSLNMVFFISA